MINKTLFSVYGYGLGHATRSEAIMNALKGEVRVAASENAYDYFKQKGLNPVKINSFKIGNIMKSFSWVQTLFENVDFPFNMIADYNIIKRLVKDFKPDAIISDSEPVSLLYADTAGITNYFLSNMIPIIKEYDNIPSKLKNNKLDSEKAVVNMLLNQVLKKTNYILSPTINHYNMGSKVKFTDLIIRKKASGLKPVKRLPDDFILVSFGGAKITNEYYNSVIPVLKKIKDEQFIVSTNHAVKRKTKTSNLTLHPFIDNYLPVLKCCKAVICLAGHGTISESLVYGKPCFTIPIEGHIEQLTNAAIIKERGFGKSFFFKHDIKESELEKSIKIFLDKLKDYKKMIKKAGFKGDGDKECARIIEKRLK